MNAKPENFNVYLTPHMEKYQTQDSETADMMLSTWNFGNELKGKGYNLIYMCGPVGLYEGNLLITETLQFENKDHVKEFVDNSPKDKMLYFLYAKEGKTLRYTALPVDLILEQRGLRKKSKKYLTNRKKPDSIIERKEKDINDSETK